MKTLLPLLLFCCLFSCKSKNEQESTLSETEKITNSDKETPPNASKQSTSNSEIVTYNQATVYAGATDYFFMNARGADIKIRVSNIPMEDNSKDLEVIVPDDLLQSNVPDEGPPGANLYVVGHQYKLIKNDLEEIMEVQEMEQDFSKIYTKEKLSGIWMREKDKQTIGLEFTEGGSLFPIQNKKAYSYEIQEDQILYRKQGNRTGSTNAYTIKALSSRHLILSKGTSGKNIVFLRTLPQENQQKWVGKWTGRKNSTLDIIPNDNGYYLIFRNHKKPRIYHGETRGDKIQFSRFGKRLFIRTGNGIDTGIRSLAGHSNCIYIKKGEGFCREE